VVIDQINIGGVALLKAEDDPPVGAHGDAPVPREVAFERMEPEARQVELFRSGRFVETGQHTGDFVHVLRVHLAPVIVFVKSSQAAMSKLSDHRQYVQ